MNLMLNVLTHTHTHEVFGRGGRVWHLGCGDDVMGTGLSPNASRPVSVKRVLFCASTKSPLSQENTKRKHKILVKLLELRLLVTQK